MGNLPSNHEHVTTVVTKIRIYFDLSDTCSGSILGVAVPLAKNSTFQKFSGQEVGKQVAWTDNLGLGPESDRKEFSLNLQLKSVV